MKMLWQRELTMRTFWQTVDTTVKVKYLGKHWCRDSTGIHHGKCWTSYNGLTRHTAHHVWTSADFKCNLDCCISWSTHMVALRAAVQQVPYHKTWPGACHHRWQPTLPPPSMPALNSYTHIPCTVLLNIAWQLALPDI
jgi:hypothetical protein